MIDLSREISTLPDYQRFFQNVLKANSKLHYLSYQTAVQKLYHSLQFFSQHQKEKAKNAVLYEK